MSDSSVGSRGGCQETRSRAALVLALLAAGCGGGGGGGASGPAVSFAFATPKATIAEDGGSLDVQVVLSTTNGPLAQEESVELVDDGSGGSTPGDDYLAFTPQTLVFPAGSASGDTAVFVLTVLDDQLVEGADERVRLRLQNPSRGSASTVRFSATITDIHLASIAFQAGTAATPDESAVPREVAARLTLPAGVALGVDVSARIADAGNGSATAGADYASFSPASVSFPAGSASGALQSVAVNVLDDALVEADETLRLSLSQPSAGATLGANTVHVLTITDDDGSSEASLRASEGPTGVENMLAYNAQLDLGSQAVQAGPNSGTLVRIQNAGDAAMSLGVPRLTGNHPDDFAVEVESASLQAAAAPPSAETVDLPTPLLAAPVDAGPGLPLELEAGLLAELAHHERVTLHGFPLPGRSAVTLQLERRPLPIEPGAELRVDGKPMGGGLRAALGDLSLWSGVAMEVPGSRVFLALSSQGSRGFLELPDQPAPIVHLFTEGPAREGAPALARIAAEADFPLAASQRPESACESLLAPGIEPPPQLAGLPPPESLTATNCRLALETDFQLYQKLGTVNATTNYVTQLIAAVSERYFTDVQTTLSIAYLAIYSSSNDPWTSQDSGGNASSLLAEFRAAWSGGWPASAELAHFISGANLGGGVAYVNVLCNQSYGFGVSGNINANINWGSWTGQAGAFTWDFVVVAHELGHNFGSQHTHAYCPPLDTCASNCTASTACQQGTLMSYCHSCGGMANLQLVFHPVCANIMRSAVHASCMGMGVLAGGDWVQYRVRFQPLTAAGARSANLLFSHDAPNTTQPFRIRLQGTATD